MSKPILSLTLSQDTLALRARLRIKGCACTGTESPNVEVGTAHLCIVTELLDCVHFGMNSTMEIAWSIGPRAHSIGCDGQYLAPQNNRSNMGECPLCINLGSRIHRLEKIVLDFATHGIAPRHEAAWWFQFLNPASQGTLFQKLEICIHLTKN